VLVCSTRTSVIRDLVRELEELAAEPEVAGEPDEWAREPPQLAYIDMAGGTRRVRAARRAFGSETVVLALVDNESAPGLIGAFAAGCDDYIFFPINPAELRLSWTKHLESERRPTRWSASGEHMVLEFPSDVAYLDDVVAQVVEACEDRAISEAICNAILYGNRQDPSKRVRLEAEFAADRIAVTVADEGPGFDPELIPDPTRPENRRRSHGRGLFLLRSLMDEVVFNQAGNMVTLVLRR
jgi:hypothetical protein